MSEIRPSYDRRLWWVYAALVLAVGLLQSISELQHYLARGGSHPWEPFLWELSSAFCVGWLGILIYRWHVAGLRCARAWQRWGRHVLGALAYIVAHSSGMFGIRFAVYALMQVPYEPGSALEVLAYEAGKDLVAYTVFVAVSHGLYLGLEAQRRQHELERLRSELAEARLSRLAEQVQPHFLFNTLNLISSTMYEDAAKADLLLCQLAELLRHTLSAQQAGWHSLDAELALVAPFLALMQARFGSRLTVRITADAAARQCRMPALLLISPVENAIKHDVALSSAAVQVSVNARCEGQLLLIEVENSGAAPARSEREGATGLANLRARVQACYGSAGTVSLSALTAGGAVLRLRLPLLQQHQQQEAAA